ncbi:MAG: beta-ketoacyl-ACP synthase II [Planctomycetia bacterium]|nr:beta-ketoacyl-ACP synthase II [Planctomycetia bacterium]
MIRRKVVVTGMGAISSLGFDVPSFWNGLMTGRCGVRRISQFDPSAFTCQVAAEVPDYKADDWFERRVVSRTARFSQFLLIAAREAWQQAGLPKEPQHDPRHAIVIGNGIGGLEVDSESHRKLFDKGPGRMPPMTIPRMIVNEGAGNLALEFGLGGRAHSIVTACSSGTDAIGHAMELIQFDKADLVLTGGVEAAITEFGLAAFCNLKALSTHYNDTPEKASRPFDRDRDGFVMGEGAGLLVLESEEHALARGATILAEVAGYGATTDGFHLTAPDPTGSGAAAAFKMAMADAQMTPADIDYINAHGTGTDINDPTETAAIHAALGEHAANVRISSIKGHIGHCLGAAGALEAIASVLAIGNAMCPPTLNLDNVDDRCDLNYTPLTPVPAEIKAVLSSSLGFGGHNGVLALRQYEPRR